MEEQHSDSEHMSSNAVKILRDIGNIWDILQKEPDRTTPGLNYSVIWCPSAMSYWFQIEALEKHLELLAKERPDLVSNVFAEFLHTKNKECSYVKDFQPNTRKKDVKNKEELARLMKKATAQIELDLYSILQHSNHIKEESTD